MQLVESTTKINPTPLPASTPTRISTDSPTLLAHYQIIRRNGAVVPFEPAKIAVAMMKAFLAVHGTQGAASASVRETVDVLTQGVVRALVRSRPGGGTFHIEDVQDQVELGLMRGGHHEIARAYVLYRERRTQERAHTKEQAAPATPVLHVLEGGQRVPLDLQHLQRLINDACAGLGADVQAEPILAETMRNLYDGVPMDEVRKSLILSARSLIEKDPGYSRATARLLRMAGFDTAYDNNYADAAIEALAQEEDWIILSRDRELLKRRGIRRGAFIRAQVPQEQMREIVARFQLAGVAKPFSRCLECNVPLRMLSVEEAAASVPPRVRERQRLFSTCDVCRRVYWPGSHWMRMNAVLAGMLAGLGIGWWGGRHHRRRARERASEAARLEREVDALERLRAALEGLRDVPDRDGGRGVRHATFSGARRTTRRSTIATAAE